MSREDFSEEEELIQCVGCGKADVDLCASCEAEAAEERRRMMQGMHRGLLVSDAIKRRAMPQWPWEQEKERGM